MADMAVLTPIEACPGLNLTDPSRTHHVQTRPYPPRRIHPVLRPAFHGINLRSRSLNASRFAWSISS